MPYEVEAMLMTATIAVVIKLAQFENRNPYVWGIAYGCAYIASWLAFDWWPVVRLVGMLGGVFVAMFVANLVKPVETV